MEQVTLAASRRTESGSRPARRMRHRGLVPAVVYGRGLEPLHVAVDRRELTAALRTEAGLNAIFNVAVDKSEPVLAVAREIQRHPVRGEITHLDFIKVSLDVAIEAEVGIEYVGTPEPVRDGAAIVETIATTVLIEALPGAVPGHISVDVSDLEVGDTLKVADLPPVEGVTYRDDADRALLTVLVPRVEEPEEAEEILEGEEAEAAEERTVEEAQPDTDEGDAS